MKTTYTAKFSAGIETRTSEHFYSTASVAIKDGKMFWTPVFSSGNAKARMPGDGLRSSARAMCYSANQKAKYAKMATEADAGWVVERVNVEVAK